MKYFANLVELYLPVFLVCACCNGTPYLPYIDFNAIPNPDLLTIADDEFSIANLPSSVAIGANRTDTAYVSTNGFIGLSSFDVGFNVYIPQTFPIDEKMVAPYWADIDLRSTGRLRHAVVESDLPDILQDISDFISNSQNTVFTSEWALVAEWMNVCPFDGNQGLCSNSNTFQAIVTTDGTSTYSIFTYKCGDLNWASANGAYATIGYSIDANLFNNHPLSGTANVNDVACLNEPQSVWSNIVNKLSISHLPLLDLAGMETTVVTEDDNSEPVELPSPIPFGVNDLSHTTAFVSTNGLVAFMTQLTSPQPKLPGLFVPLIAPFWDDIIVFPPSQVAIATVPGSSALADQVDDFLATNHSITYNTSWMLVVQWIDVCPYCGIGCTSCLYQPNTFQLVLTTDGISSYAIFTYNCLQFNWYRPTTVVGFDDGNNFFERRNISELKACANYPGTNWTNAVFHVSGAEPVIRNLYYNITLGDTVNVAVYCQAFGDPQPSISFSRGDTVTTAEHNRYTVTSILTLINVTEDSFNVSCTTTNAWRNTSQEINIDTKVSPKFSVHPESSLLQEYSSSFQLTCAAMGNPAPSVQWLKDGKPVSASLYNQTNSANFTTTSVLSISFTEYSTNGSYQCEAGNFLENAAVSNKGLVFVYTPLNLVSSPSNVTMSTGSPVRLECTFVSFPPPTITWHQNSLPVSEGNVNISTTGNTTTSILILDQMTSAGTYGCVAEFQLEGWPIETRYSKNATIMQTTDIIDTRSGFFDSEKVYTILVPSAAATLLLVIVVATGSIILPITVRHRRNKRKAAWIDPHRARSTMRERVYSEIPTMVRPQPPPLPAPRGAPRVGERPKNVPTGENRRDTEIISRVSISDCIEDPLPCIHATPNLVYDMNQTPPTHTVINIHTSVETNSEVLNPMYNSRGNSNGEVINPRPINDSDETDDIYDSGGYI